VGQLLHRRTSKNKQEPASKSSTTPGDPQLLTKLQEQQRRATHLHRRVPMTQKDTGEVGFGEVILHDQSAKSRESEREM